MPETPAAPPASGPQEAATPGQRAAERWNAVFWPVHGGEWDGWAGLSSNAKAAWEAAAEVAITQDELAAALEQFGLHVTPTRWSRTESVGAHGMTVHGTVADPREVARVLLVTIEARRAHARAALKAAP